MLELQRGDRTLRPQAGREAFKTRQMPIVETAQLTLEGLAGGRDMADTGRHEAGVSLCAHREPEVSIFGQGSILEAPSIGQRGEDETIVDLRPVPEVERRE